MGSGLSAKDRRLAQPFADKLTELLNAETSNGDVVDIPTLRSALEQAKAAWVVPDAKIVKASEEQLEDLESTRESQLQKIANVMPTWDIERIEAAVGLTKLRGVPDQRYDDGMEQLRWIRHVEGKLLEAKETFNLPLVEEVIAVTEEQRQGSGTIPGTFGLLHAEATSTQDEWEELRQWWLGELRFETLQWDLVELEKLLADDFRFKKGDERYDEATTKLAQLRAVVKCQGGARDLRADKRKRPPPPREQARQLMEAVRKRTQGAPPPTFTLTKADVLKVSMDPKGGTAIQVPPDLAP